ncbi:hypothetical protein LDENG_00037780 [Lucifuga dentata]|nr:hypothetical protein LDENG_00037780 [Lucifuga dentata]
MHQLHRMFRAAADKYVKHWARLVSQQMDAEIKRTEKKEKRKRRRMRMKPRS